MDKDYLAIAIQSLRPTAEFTYTANDYSTIQWDILEGDAPSITEINKEIARIKKAELTEQADRATAKAALLERLGITAEEANLLLS
jgi:hypothetical protein